MKTVVPQGTGGSNPPCSDPVPKKPEKIRIKDRAILSDYWGFEPERCCNNLKAQALHEQIPAQDAPGNAQAGVERANRMFATGTPNPPCSG